MHSSKRIRQFERDNRRSAERILTDPERFGAGLVAWAKGFLADQRAERAADRERQAAASGQRQLDFGGGAA